MLADLQTQITAAGLPEPVAEYRFHPIRRWRFDLAWPDKLCAVEIDGAVWISGRHTRGKGYTKDCEKLNEAVLLGWRVLRVTTEQVVNGEALRWVEQLLAVLDVEKKREDKKE